MMAKLRVLAAIFFTGWGCFETITLSYLMSRERFESAFVGIVTRWARRVLWVLTVEVRVRGEMPTVHPAVLVANHQSLLDIPVLFGLLPHIKIIAKTELFRIPVFGRALRRAGILEIDRGNRERAHQTIDHAAERVRGGVSILIFAEGTRSRDRHIHPFKKGAFVLASRTEVPIIPIAVRGCVDRLPRGIHQVIPGPVEVGIGEPIPPLGPRARDELRTRTEAAVRDLYNGLGAEEGVALADRSSADQQQGIL